MENPHPDAPLIEDLATALAGVAGLRALFLSGSHGRGTADRFSDVDLLGVAEAEAKPAVIAAFRATLESGPGCVFFQELFGGRLCNAITPGWRRVDIFLPEGLEGRAQNLLVPLFDPEGLHGTLPERLPPVSPLARTRGRANPRVPPGPRSPACGRRPRRGGAAGQGIGPPARHADRADAAGGARARQGRRAASLAPAAARGHGAAGSPAVSRVRTCQHCSTPTAPWRRPSSPGPARSTPAWASTGPPVWRPPPATFCAGNWGWRSPERGLPEGPPFANAKPKTAMLAITTTETRPGRPR